MADTDWADRIFASFAEEYREDVTSNLAAQTHAWRACESPIERVFAVAFTLVHGYKYGRPLTGDSNSIGGDAPQMFLIPQYRAGDYRVDFLVGWNIGDHRHTSIVVECDGHDFHERTKRQAARDKSRDRFLSSEFARVLRFTGSEIYKSPVRCAAEAEGISEDVFWSWYMRGQGE